MLKLDIEGAERVVLREAAPHLHRVQRLFVEYHSYAGQTQDLPELLVLLRDAGFRISLLMPDAISPRPFEEVRTSVGMDLRVNVFGTRK